MESSKLTVIATGGYSHPWGDTTPITCRYQEEILSQRLPEKQILLVDRYTVLETRLPQPRGVIVSNLTGKHLTAYPDPETAEQLRNQVLLVGLTDGSLEQQPRGWQELRASKVGEDLPGSTILWLARDTRVVLVPRWALHQQPEAPPLVVQVLVIPGDE